MCVRLLLSSLLLWMTGSSPSYPSTCLGGKWELHLPVQAITGAILSDSILSCFSVWLIIISTISVYGFATHHLNLLKGGVCVSCNFLCLQPILHPGFSICTVHGSFLHCGAPLPSLVTNLLVWSMSSLPSSSCQGNWCSSTPTPSVVTCYGSMAWTFGAIELLQGTDVAQHEQNTPLAWTKSGLYMSRRV